MPQVLVRVGRRRSAWESTDAVEIARVEFRDRRANRLDLRPSVYIVEEAEQPGGLVRVVAEHTASFVSPPKPNGTVAYDLQGAGGELTPCVGETPFWFANEAHAELVMENEAALLAAVQQVRASFQARLLPLRTADLFGYIRDRLVADDQEWARALDPDVRGWKAAVQKTA